MDTLALVALCTIFLGLVGVLAVIGECQKRRRRRSSTKPEGHRGGGHDSLNQVVSWLTEHEQSLPTAQQVLDVLSDSLRKYPSKEWRDMTLSSLTSEDLSGMEVPEVVSMDGDRIEFVCKLEDLPGVGVACISEQGEKIECDVKVEWLYALMRVVFAVDGERLVVSVSHKDPVKMSLSCSPGASLEDGERIASSVADDLHMWFTTLALDNAPVHSPIPSVHVSYHDDGTNASVGQEGASNLGDHTPPEPLVDYPPEAPPTLQPRDDQTVPSSSGETKRGEPPVLAESGEPVQEETTSQVLATQQRLEQDNVVSAMPLTAVVEETEEERGNDCLSQELPTSPTWRRSPSYEQLQQIALDPQRLTHSFSRGVEPGSPHLMGPTADKRALTLSVSGSEAESIYGADERIPSTLVYEITDSQNKIRHIVAVTTAHAVKLRRRYPHAKKLHIYNDHCFTATHLKKRVECSVCGSKISGLFGRQAYVCRDCEAVVHKHCHYKTDGQCPQSQLHHMNLIYPDNTSTSSAN